MCGESERKGSEESVTDRAGPLESNNRIHYLIMHIVYVQVCIIIVLSSYKVRAVLGCSSGLLILRDCGAIIATTCNTTVAAVLCARL